MNRFIKRFEVVFQKNPFLVGCSCASVLVGTGNLITQVFVEDRRFFPAKKQKINPHLQKDIIKEAKATTNQIIHKKNQNQEIQPFSKIHKIQEEESQAMQFEWGRLGRYMLITFFVVAPNLGMWYRFCLPWVFRLKHLKTLSKTKKSIIGAILDQTIFISYWHTLFFFSHGLVTTGSFEEAYEHLKANLGPRATDGWVVWPFLSFINLRFVKRMYRGIYVNSLWVIWGPILAHPPSKEKVRRIKYGFLRRLGLEIDQKG